MQLERVQADFAAALMDARAAPVLLPAMVGDKGRALDRLALYRGNVSAGWEKALTNAFPVVRALVGNEFFAALAHAYGQGHPSVSGDLGRFGAEFAGFVRTFEHTQSLPYLCDVAALEWAVHCAQSAADANPLARERIMTMSPEDLLAAHFELHPACRWIESRFPIASIWRAHQAQPTIALPESLDRSEYALITRPSWHVTVAESCGAEIAALKQLSAGGDIGSAIGAALAKDARFDFSKALVRWLDCAVLVRAL